jgi:hypothetical protein
MQKTPTRIRKPSLVFGVKKLKKTKKNFAKNMKLISKMQKQKFGAVGV